MDGVTIELILTDEARMEWRELHWAAAKLLQLANQHNVTELQKAYALVLLDKQRKISEKRLAYYADVEANAEQPVT